MPFKQLHEKMNRTILAWCLMRPLYLDRFTEYVCHKQTGVIQTPSEEIYIQPKTKGDVTYSQAHTIRRRPLVDPESLLNAHHDEDQDVPDEHRTRHHHGADKAGRRCGVSSSNDGMIWCFRTVTNIVDHNAHRFPISMTIVVFWGFNVSGELPPLLYYQSVLLVHKDN